MVQAFPLSHEFFNRRGFDLIISAKNLMVYSWLVLARILEQGFQVL